MGGRSGAGKRLSTTVEASRVRACVREGAEWPVVTAGEVVKAYVNAVNGTIAVIRFGAMLVSLDNYLTCETAQTQRNQHSGETIKAWLTEHVPDVNYKTAMRMKGTAEAVCKGLGVEAEVMMRALSPDPKLLTDEQDAEALIAARERVVEIVHGKSERSLVLWLKGGAPVPPEGEQAENTEKAEEAALDSARRFGRAVADALKCLDNRKKRVVSKDVAKLLREALGLKGLAWLAKVLEEAEQ